MIRYSIEAAIESRLFDKLVVSTDDEEIANISIKYGAEAPFRRQVRTDLRHLQRHVYIVKKIHIVHGRVPIRVPSIWLEKKRNYLLDL